MNTRGDYIASGRIFEAGRHNPGDLTHKQLEDYLSEGRRLQSVYVVGLLSGLWRRLRRGGAWVTAWLGARRQANGRPSVTKCVTVCGKP